MNYHYPTAVHVYRKYPHGKFEDDLEAQRWKVILKKINSAIRYERSQQKKIKEPKS